MADNSQTFRVEVDFQTKNKELLDKANKTAKETATQAKSIKNAYALYGDELKKLNPELVKQIELEKAKAAVLAKSKEAARQLTAQIKNLRAEAKEIRASVALMKDAADDLDRFAKPMFAVGAFVVGGIFAAANKYVNEAKEATATTIAWKKAQDDLNKSSLRIGEVLATQALPLLQKVVAITDKIATFVETHPELISAGLNAGLAALTLGAIGKAVSGGIRFYADLKLDAVLTLQMTAAQLQLKAAQAQLAASGASKGIGVGATAATAATGAGGLSVGGFVGIAAASAAMTLALSVGFAKLVESLTGVELPILKVIRYLKGLGDQSEESATAATADLEQERAADQAARELRQQEREARLAYAQEMLQSTISLLANEKIEKIRGLQSFFVAESQLRRQAMVNGLNDLGRNLNAEITMKREAFQTILNQAADLLRNAWNSVQSFLGGGSSSSSIGTAGGGSTSSGGSGLTTSQQLAQDAVSFIQNLWSNIPTRDSGGYMNKGVYRGAWNGDPEFVLSGNSTRAMEKMVGGKLTQENVMQTRGGNMTMNYNPRFSGEITNADRRALRKDMQEVVTSALKGAL